MERRKFLFSLCAAGGTAVAVNAAVAGQPVPRIRRARIVNSTEQTIYLKVVGALPGCESSPERGGVLFPEEAYFADLGEGKRVVIAWNHTGEKVLTMKEVNVVTPCQVNVYEGDVAVSYEV